MLLLIAYLVPGQARHYQILRFSATIERWPGTEGRAGAQGSIRKDQVTVLATDESIGTQIDTGGLALGWSGIAGIPSAP